MQCFGGNAAIKPLPDPSDEESMKANVKGLSLLGDRESM